METQLELREIIKIFWMRKWYFLIPAMSIMAVFIAGTFMLTPLYMSQATLLIERQDIPENIVPSLVTEQFDRRMEFITREVLVTENLLRIADRHNLYSDERDVLRREAVAGKMRGRIQTETLLAAINDDRTGRRSQATLGFRISFLDADPRLAQRVTNDLASAYLSTNAKSRRVVAERTTDFLAAEREALEKRIATIEDELNRFKTEHRDLLPAEAAFQRQLLNNLEQQLRGLEGDLRVLRERESYLSTQLALLDEFETPRGRGDNPESRLELLRAELATAQARYSASHPDVARLRREVSSLERVVGTRAGSSELAEREATLNAELASLRERYTEEHPDVQRVRRELAAVRESVGNGDGAALIGGASRNNSFIQLSAQLNSVRAEISAVEEQRAMLQEERLVLQEQLARAPTIELEYNRIMRRLQNAVADRNELAEKETAAKLSSSLETAAAGEQLTLIEPPTLPGSPHSPNKPLILAVGFVVAVGSGGTLLVLVQLLDRSIRSVRQLSRIVGEMPLVTIPVILTAADQRRKWFWRFGSAIAVLIVVSGGLTWLHLRVVPLDVLGYQAANSAEEWIGKRIPLASGDGSDAVETQ